MGSVRIELTVAGLAEALALRGVRVSDDGRALLAAKMRRWPGPVILVTRDIAAALDAGADDGVAPDTPAEEIAARIAARLRRVVGVGDLRIDRLARHVTRADRALSLLPREYALLDHLAARAGETVPRAELLHAIWGLRFDPGTNLVAVHVSRLRAKIDRGFDRALLHTEKGIGYRLAAL